MKIGQKVKHFYIDHKGNKQFGCQTGEIIRFTDYWGYPAAECHFFKFSSKNFTLVDHHSVQLVEELEVV